MLCWNCGDKVSGKKAHYTMATVRSARTGKAEPTKRPVCAKCAKETRRNA